MLKHFMNAHFKNLIFVDNCISVNGELFKFCQNVHFSYYDHLTKKKLLIKSATLVAFPLVSVLSCFLFFFIVEKL